MRRRLAVCLDHVRHRGLHVLIRQVRAPALGRHHPGLALKALDGMVGERSLTLGDPIGPRGGRGHPINQAPQRQREKFRARIAEEKTRIEFAALYTRQRRTDIA